MKLFFRALKLFAVFILLSMDAFINSKLSLFWAFAFKSLSFASLRCKFTNYLIIKLFYVNGIGNVPPIFVRA